MHNVTPTISCSKNIQVFNTKHKLYVKTIFIYWLAHLQRFSSLRVLEFCKIESGKELKEKWDKQSVSLSTV